MPVVSVDPDPNPTTPDSARTRVGLLGLEGQHQFQGGVVLNTPLSSRWPSTADYPRYRLRRIRGLHSIPDSDQEDSQSRMGQIGEKPLPAVLRGKTVTYEGEIQALDLTQLRQAEDDLRATFGDVRAEGVMFVNPHPDATRGLPMFFRGRVMALDVDDEQTYRASHVPSPFCRPFTLSLRLGDPRAYDRTEQTAAATWDGAQAQLTAPNPGNAPTDPVLRVVGPTNGDWRLDYAGDPARFLAVSGIALTGSEHVDVNFAERSIIRSDGADLTNLVTPASDWWDEGVYGLDPRSTATVTLTMGAGVLPPPGGVVAEPVMGGTLAAATYYYVVTALNAAGQTVASVEVPARTGQNVYEYDYETMRNVVIGTVGSVLLSWGEVAGASAYRVYRATVSEAQAEYVEVAAPGLTLLDDGTKVYAAGSPPATNTADTGSASGATALSARWRPASL